MTDANDPTIEMNPNNVGNGDAADTGLHTPDAPSPDGPPVVSSSHMSDASPTAALLTKASKLGPMVLGGVALAVLLVAGGIGAAVARSSAKPVVPAAPTGPSLPPVTPLPMPGKSGTPDQLPPGTPDSLPPQVPETPSTSVGSGPVRPAPITRPPNSPRPTSGIPNSVQPPEPSPLPVDPSGGGLPVDPSGGGLPVDPSGGGLPVDPSGGGLPVDPSGGDGGSLPGALPDLPGAPELPSSTPDVEGPLPAPAGGGDNTPGPAPVPDAIPPSGQPVLIGNGVSITPAAGFDVTNKGNGFVFLASKSALVEADVFPAAEGSAEILVTEIGRGYLPKNVSNLQYGDAQISQSTSADVLSFASASFRGVLAGSQGSLDVQGVVFVAVRQDRTALAFIAMFQPGTWEQVAPAFANMFGSMLSRS
jgi:hypothetical protein